MIATLTAAVLVASPMPATEMLQRAEVRRYVAEYDRIVTPTVDRTSAAWDAMGSGFYAGTPQAVRISARAQAALAICPRAVTAIARQALPATLPAEELRGFQSYRRAKAAMYRTRCDEMRALVRYVDEPSKSSNEAALVETGDTQTRLGKNAWSAIAPTFRRLGMRRPKAW